MAKYEAERIIIKVFPRLTLVFADAKSIYAFPEADTRYYVFHSWYAPIFNYRDHWLPFKKALLKRRYLEASTCFELAAQYGVPYKTMSGKISLADKPVELRYKRWSVCGKLGEK